MRQFKYVLLLSLLSACAPAAKLPAAPNIEQKPPCKCQHAKREVTPELMQEAMAKASAIGENHHRLDPLVGSYKVEAKMWMNPGSEPMVTTGTAEFQWVLAGHYLETSYHSSFMGQPFEGRGFFGYNNVKEVYQSSWVDSMGTEMMMSEGAVESDGSTIVFNGEFQCPITNDPMKTREVLIIGKDRHTYQMFHPAIGGTEEYKAMEIVYERVAKKPSGKGKGAKK